VCVTTTSQLASQVALPVLTHPVVVAVLWRRRQQIGVLAEQLAGPLHARLSMFAPQLLAHMVCVMSSVQQTWPLAQS
jgi:hypothetical protein